MGSKAKEGLGLWQSLSCCHHPGSHPWELQPRGKAPQQSQEELNAPTDVWKSSRKCWKQTRTWGLCYIPWLRASSSCLSPLAGTQCLCSDTWTRHTGVKLSAQTPEPTLGSSIIPPPRMVLLLQKVLHHARSSASAFCGCTGISPLAELLAMV